MTPLTRRRRSKRVVAFESSKLLLLVPGRRDDRHLRRARAPSHGQDDGTASSCVRLEKPVALNSHTYVVSQALQSSSSILSLVVERHAKQCGAAAAVGALRSRVQATRCLRLLEAICPATGQLLRSQKAT